MDNKEIFAGTQVAYAFFC